jgi:hypothetical protein
MKATIDSTGTLTIVPESETEAYALRCYGKKFNSDTPPALRFYWEEIHSPGGCRRPAKGSSKPNQFWPFDKDETARIQQGQPPLTKSQLDLIKGSGMKTDAMRLRYLMDAEVLEGFAHVEPDRYDCASQCAEMAGRKEPNEDDELNGFRLMIDMAAFADSSAAKAAAAGA